MRLKKKYYRLISELSNYSMEICIESTFGKVGVSEKDFASFLRSYLKLLRAFPDNPHDLLTD